VIENHESNLDSKSARTRRRLLDAAAKVLSQKGYAATRLVDVAKEAGLQAPAIYYYFSSRDELIDEVLWTGVSTVHQHLEKTLADLPGETDSMQRLLAAVEAHLWCELEVSDYAIASIRNVGQVPDQLRSRSLDVERSYTRLWQQLFADAERDGALRPGADVNLSRLLLLGALNWAAEWWDPQQRSYDELVAAAQEMVRYGLGNPDRF
jgi:AcrR family transcriptional regulator